MKKKLSVVALSLLTIISINVISANAQTCPNQVAFGERPSRPIDPTLRSQIEVTYFTTDDPHVFISERDGINRSASYTNLSTNQFVAQIKNLESEGLASVRKRQSATSYLGEMAGLNLEREESDATARVIDTGLVSPKQKHVFGLDRETEISVYKGSPRDGVYYRVSLLSWFVDVTAASARKTVDYDANIHLQPGQTAVFKLMSKDEVRRSGAARSYIAVTLRSVDTVSSAKLESSRTSLALR